MNDKPTVSVVMSCCINSSVIKVSRAIDSILNQTYCDFEFIICQDGFYEPIIPLLQQYEKADKRIKIIGYADNKGLAFAMNFCIEKSLGQLIARMDDDDISKPWRLERQVNYLKDNPSISFVGSSVEFQNSENMIVGSSSVIERPKKFDFLWNSPFTHPTVVFRKEALLDVGGYRVSWDTKRGQDYDLFMRMYSAGHRGANIPEPLYQYTLPISKKYRTIMMRLGEASVRLRGFEAMGILGKGLPFVIKPVLLGLIPDRIVSKHRRWNN